MRQAPGVARGMERRRWDSAPVDGSTAAAVDPDEASAQVSAERIEHSARRPSGTFAPREAVGADVLHDMTAAPLPWRATVTALVVALIDAAARL